MHAAQPVDIVTTKMSKNERRYRKDAEASAVSGQKGVVMAMDVALDDAMRTKFEEMAAIFLEVPITDRMDSDMLNEYVRIHVTLARRRSEFGPILRFAAEAAQNTEAAWTKERESYVNAAIKMDRQILELHDRLVALGDVLLLTPASRLKHIPRRLPQQETPERDVTERLFG